MAHVYVWSGASGAGTGADWANAYTTAAAAATAKAAGDNFWIAHDHAETQASALTLTSKGSAAAPCTFICVNRAGSVPPVSADLRTTATISTTGNSAISLNGGTNSYSYGITFNCGSGAVAAALTLSLGVSGNGGIVNYKNCVFAKLGTTASVGAFNLGDLFATTNGQIVLDNCGFSFGATGDRIRFSQCSLTWKNTAVPIVGAVIPTGLFTTSTSASEATGVLEGLDLSALGAGTIQTGTLADVKVYMKDCKTHASTVIATTPVGAGGPETHVIRADSAGTNYRHEKYGYGGTQVVETTIVRTGGASNGTTPLAWKIVTGANSKWITPFKCMPITIWNDTSGSAITVTLYGIWGGGAVPTSADIWMDVAYPGSSATPLASFATSGTADFLAAATNLTTDSSTWGGSTTKFKMSVTFTPQMKGPITIAVRAALASSTFYLDPKPEISGVTVGKSFILSPGVYANELGGSGVVIAGTTMARGMVGG